MRKSVIKKLRRTLKKQYAFLARTKSVKKLPKHNSYQLQCDKKRKYEEKNLKQETGKEAAARWKLWTDTREALKFEVVFLFCRCLLGADIEASYWRHFYVEDGGTLSRCWTGPLPHRIHSQHPSLVRTCQECGNCHKFDLKFAACLCWSGPTQIKHVHIHTYMNKCMYIHRYKYILSKLAS